MYRPPENSNRVKSIKSKFESNGGELKENITRQLSDPSKRNIKRTPAFRGAPRHICDNLKKEPSAKPLLVKSKSSHEFDSIRSKFDQRNDEQSPNHIPVYTAPIPKALRVKNDIHTTSTLKIGAAPDGSLTDTMKAALKKPLPNGPAPQKPPRTFQHTPQKPEANASFLHTKPVATPPSKPKHDARYKLNKLQLALKNNKLKAAPQKLEASTTSGEDSDDSVLYKSKSQRQLPSLPSSLQKLNCFERRSLRKGYDRVNEANSEFFVDVARTEEPVYTEPCIVLRDKKDNQRSKTNSLYYMSSPILTADCETCYTTNLDNNTRKMSAGNSSLSSFTSTSDLESAASTPLEERKLQSTNIKQLISAFEMKQNVSENEQIDSARRIEDLKQTVQKTIDRLDHIKSDKIVDKFQTYVKTMPKYRAPKVNPEDRLFYCCLVVGWDGKNPQIKFKFPKTVKIPDKIEDLCFPETANGTLDSSDSAQCYSLVITNARGERTFGYCRRVMPEGSTKCIPLAYCILSKFRAPRFYKKILKELESRHGLPDKLRDELISEFYYKKFPQPGQQITVNLTNMLYDLQRVQVELRPRDDRGVFSFASVNHGGYGALNPMRHSDYENVMLGENEEKSGTPGGLNVQNNETTELNLTLHHDTRYEEADLRHLHALPPDILLKIFASMLLERKVVLISCLLCKLSSCMDALQSILYPFSWPHTFIPILPKCLWDVVDAPTPMICGVLSLDVILSHKIENGIVVDIDAGMILSEEGDENSILSESMKKSWYQGSALAKTVRDPALSYVHSVYLSDAYLKVIIVAIKHYKNHIKDNKFETEAFIRNGKSKGVRRFLKWFTETSLFGIFIDTILINPDSFTLFDQRIEMYGSEDSNLILTKLLEWKK